jgi:voltage-gated potassium channel
MLEHGGSDSRFFDFFIMALIFLNVMAIILETVDGINSRYWQIFGAFNIFSVAVFTVEYALRLWSCTVNPIFRDPIRGRARFMVTPMALVDLMAILPFYLPFVSADFRFLRSVRLFRLFRLLKLARYTESTKVIIAVFKQKKEDLTVTFFALVLLLVVSSCLIYEAEHSAQPEAFSSIPAAMWWGVITLATVGYGDMYPITPLGKLVGSMVVFMGILLLALPTGIFVTGYIDELQKGKSPLATCPHCGMRLDKRPASEEGEVLVMPVIK